MQKTDDSSLAVNDNLKEGNWLKLAEYASVAGSALGTLAAVFSGQIIYAAAPLTVALSLNLVNRQRFEEQIRENAKSAIADVHTVVESIHREVHGLPENPQDSQDLSEILSDLQQKLHVIEHSILGEQDWETINVRFLLLDEKLNNVKNSIISLTNSGNTDLNLDTVSTSVNQSPTLTNQVAPNFTELETQIHHLQEQICQLQEQNREIVKPHLQRLIRAVKQLQET
jgi:predicted transcriptional regulator